MVKLTIKDMVFTCAIKGQNVLCKD